MKRIYPEELKVQTAHSFYTATGVKLLKTQLLTSTTMFLFRLCEYEALKHHSRQQQKKKETLPLVKLFLQCQRRNDRNCYTLVVIMLSSILVDRVVFLCTQDNVTLLRTSELDTRTWGWEKPHVLVSSAANNIHSQQALLDSGDDMLRWLCLCHNYLWLTKAHVTHHWLYLRIWYLWISQRESKQTSSK